MVNEYELKYTLHPNAKIGKNVSIGEYSVIRDKVTIGNDSEIHEGVTVGSKPIWYENFKRKNAEFGICIGNNTIIHSGARIVLGTTRNTIIKDDCVIAQNVIIGHDSILNNKCRIMNGCTLNGYVEIGSLSMIGARSVIRERIKIGKNVIIGQSSNVTKNVPDNVIAYGNPCKIIKKNNTDIKYMLKMVGWVMFDMKGL